MKPDNTTRDAAMCELCNAEIAKVMHCAEAQCPHRHRPPATTEPAESEGKNLAAKIHLSDDDAKLLEDFRNAVQKPPVDATEDAKAWGMLAEFEMSGNYWRDRDTVRFAIEYAAKLLAERDEADKKQTITAFIHQLEEAADYVGDVSMISVEAMRSVAREMGVEVGK